MDETDGRLVGSFCSGREYDRKGTYDFREAILGKTGKQFTINAPFWCDFGYNAVIGAGSVVNRDIPAGVVAAGNPCRVIRRITDADREKYKIWHCQEAHNDRKRKNAEWGMV